MLYLPVYSCKRAKQGDICHRQALSSQISLLLESCVYYIHERAKFAASSALLLLVNRNQSTQLQIQRRGIYVDLVVCEVKPLAHQRLR